MRIEVDFLRSTPMRKALPLPSSRAALARKASASPWLRLPMVEPEKKPSRFRLRATGGRVRVLVKSAISGTMVSPSCCGGQPLGSLLQALGGDIDGDVGRRSWRTRRAGGSSCGSTPTRTRPAREQVPPARRSRRDAPRAGRPRRGSGNIPRAWRSPRTAPSRPRHRRSGTGCFAQAARSPSSTASANSS